MSKFKPIMPLILITICAQFPSLPPLLYAQATSDCSLTDFPTRLAVGLWARVASGDTHNVREDAGIRATIVARVPDGDIFRVMAGPTCADGFWWWQVNYTGQVGWIAEGDLITGEYWLEPLAGQTPPAPQLENGLKPSGCQKPPDDYTRIWINQSQLNLRTLAMLDYAQEFYRAEGGIIHFRQAIVQGSYNPGAVKASFGTHDGGGAVDLSVRDPQDYHVLASEIAPMLKALRYAGFAAWLREPDSLYAGSPIHIHAIAVGDADLSDAARGQLDGPFGYFRGYDGLPRDDGIPQPDTSGDMILCQWMVDMGFQDLRGR